VALDFPTSPSVGQTYTSGGIVWQWDGAKWVNSTGLAGAVSSWNTRTGAVVMNSGDVTTALTFTPYNATNPSGYQTAAQVTAAIPTAGYVDNGGFAINQRSYVSGTALAAGAFGHDRWKGGAGGCTYTFTQSGAPATTITITAGTLQQVVEGAALIGGTYTLSWTGTAQGRVGAGSYAASPVTVSGIVASANTTIEFNTGTVGQVKFEAGSTATSWVAMPPRYVLSNCQRFYQRGAGSLSGYGPAAGGIAYSSMLPVPMRATPTYTSSPVNQINCSGFSVAADANAPSAAVYLSATGGSAGAFALSGSWTATADL
jgi:hypothetical protein